MPMIEDQEVTGVHTMPVEQLINLLESSFAGLTSSKADELLVAYGHNMQVDEPTKCCFCCTRKAPVRDVGSVIVLRRQPDGSPDQETMNSTDIVPGDVIIVRAGDTVPADCRLVTVQAGGGGAAAGGFVVSHGNYALPKAPSNAEFGTRLARSGNMILMNSVVTAGSATCIVTGTGELTAEARSERAGTSLFEPEAQENPLAATVVTPRGVNEIPRLWTPGQNETPRGQQR